MAITPNTDIYLIKCPLESDNLNQLTFTNKANQANYFSNLPHKLIQNCSYLRKDNVIRYPGHIDELINYNYVMYKNNNYSNKYFYAFITNMEYVNDNMTNIYIKTDVYQTWLFDIEFKKSFVEREHVNNDSVGLHTFPEQLETGEYISTKLQPSFVDVDDTMCFCIGVTTYLTSEIYSTSNQKIPSGIKYIGLTTYQGVIDVCHAYDIAGQGDAINSVFVIPKSFFRNWHNTTIIIDEETVVIDGQTSNTVVFEYSKNIEVATVNYLGNDYIPKNKKLLCYPYSFLQVSNHNGTVINYNWEDFNLLQIASEGKIVFSLRGTITPGGSFSAYPVNYKNILSNFDEGIQLGKFPIGGWNNDVYTNWLTQNGVNISLNNISGATQILSGAFGVMTGRGELSGVGSISNGINGILDTVASKYQHSLIPDQAKGNVNVGDYSYQFGLTNLEFKRISIKNEYAQIIDNFFSMYGYKVNVLKIPNITGRRNWNYVKTIGANIEGNIPQNDIEEIKSIFNNGVTLWHNPSTFLDYSQNNGII